MTKNNKSYAEEYAKLQLEKITHRAHTWCVVKEVLLMLAATIFMSSISVFYGVLIKSLFVDGATGVEIFGTVMLGITILTAQFGFIWCYGEWNK